MQFTTTSLSFMLNIYLFLQNVFKFVRLLCNSKTWALLYQQPSVFSAKCGPDDLGNASAWFLLSFSNISLFKKLETYVFATDSLICRQGLTWVLAENMLTPSLALSTSATDGSPFRPSYIDELNSNRRRDVAGVLFDNIDRFVLFFFSI